jgi:3-hydroxyisobutyryl-CoA hydrolase
VLIEKGETGLPAWSPASLDQVDAASLEAFFGTEESAPQLVLPEVLGDNHPNPPSFLRYGLPSEDELQALVDGHHPSSGGGAVTLQELITKAETLRSGKRGVAGKVQEVVSRRCTVDREGYLQWKQ